MIGLFDSKREWLGPFWLEAGETGRFLYRVTSGGPRSEGFLTEKKWTMVEAILFVFLRGGHPPKRVVSCWFP